MSFARWSGGVVLSLFVAVVLLGGGCNKGGERADNKPSQPQTGDKKEHDHSADWCAEHGIWERVGGKQFCARCDAKLMKKMKSEGDWCEKHERPLSQCFICDPKLQEKYAAEYKAKYGKEPPPITDP